jgi:hypothetical protein
MHLNQHISTALVFALAIAPASAAVGQAAGAGRGLRPSPEPQALTAHAGPTGPRPPQRRTAQPASDTHAAGGATDSPRPRPELTHSGSNGDPLVAPVVVRVSTPSGGFDWGDAGIGAAGTLGIVILALAGALAVMQRRAGGTGDER